MEKNFNFLNQPIVSALLDAAHLLPGLDQVDLLHYDEVKGAMSLKRLKCKETTKSYHEVEIDGDVKNACRNFRINNKSSNWYDTVELPFILEKASISTPDIFQEILKSVLCIGFPNEKDGANDVFVFYFRKDASEFGPMRQDKVLETTQKIVIERLLKSSLASILKNYQQNRLAMVAHNQQIQALISSQKQQIEQAKKDVLYLEKQLDTIIIGILEEIKEDGDVVRVADDAKEILRNHIHDLPLVKRSLKKVFAFAKTLSFGLANEEIVLQKDYFSDLKSMILETQDHEVRQADPYSIHTKTYRFLDALENAAKKLNAKGTKLTSNLVGSMLEQPITAAAISDKLKNHSKKVNLLLQQYPDNWKIIRYKFRPIVNIQERASEADVA